MGHEPVPPPMRSRISPPVPVAAPLKGSTVVGKLWVSAFSEMTLSMGFTRNQSAVDWSAGANCSTTGPWAKATLSL